MTPASWNEKSLEDLIETHLLASGYEKGTSASFDRINALDRAALLRFLESTQKDALDLYRDEAGAKWQDKLFEALALSIGRWGVVHALLNGFKCGASGKFALYYPRPTVLSTQAQVDRWNSNVFSITRQLHFSNIAAADSLDMAVFVNGLPIATFELKNAFTHQNVVHAMRQYKDDRPAKEPLFNFGRCLVHFAVDSDEAYMTTHLRDAKTGFLPFNKGTANGGGNPPGDVGPRTAYLWEQVFTPDGLGELLEGFAKMVEEKGDDNKKLHKLLFPRYHQRDCVLKLLAHAANKGAGHKYLIQHSAGSGKSNTIGWLCKGLVGLQQGGDALFDTVVLVTDLRILDSQIAATVLSIVDDKNLVMHAQKGSFELKHALQSGKKIVVTTIQKFPFVLDQIGDLPQSRFAIVIDEAHSSQGGKVAGKMNAALGGGFVDDDDEPFEDKLNALMEARKMLPNASYFAFTATPKPKTLETFGELGGDGSFAPFHQYTMKQAIAEGFILDVLKNYTTYNTFYTLVKKIDSDPDFEVSKAQKKLRAMVERHPDSIAKKAAIMLEHFTGEVVNRMDNRARAMIVTGGIEQAIRYKWAVDAWLREHHANFEAIVAFSGEKEVDGNKFTEEGMNGFESGKIKARFREPKFRLLIVADKFQTGFDEPLLHTMYVDKMLGGVQAVQTLSRLNRCHPLKTETFVLDFANKAEVVREAFEPFYEGTTLVEETDINRLNFLQDDIEKAQLWTHDEIEDWCARLLNGEDRQTLEPKLDAVVERYKELEEDEQVKFKGDLKNFLRGYEFLSSIRPFKRADWEMLSIFGGLLLPKLPAPKEDDLAKGVLEATGLHSYRVVRENANLKLNLEGDGEIEPAQISGGGLKPEAKLDKLSQIIKDFNDRFGRDATAQQADFIAKDAPGAVAGDEDYLAAKAHSDKENAREVYAKKFKAEIVKRLQTDTEFYKVLLQNQELQKWVIETNFESDYGEGLV